MLIRIDRRTVRRNPDAGRQEYIRRTGSTTTLKYWMRASHTQAAPEGLHVYVQRAVGAEDQPLRVYIEASGRLSNQGGRALEAWRKNLERNGGHVEDCTTEFHYERLRSLEPEGRWLYTYENPILICNMCGDGFHRIALRADACNYGVDEVWSNTICPLCGAWDCVDLEFEQLTDEEFEVILKDNEVPT
jgi:hypothetical protein